MRGLWNKRNLMRAANRSHPLSAGRVIDLAFAGTDIERAIDTSGYGLHGTNSGGVFSVCPQGGSWESNGTADSINLGPNSALPTQEITIVLGWRKTDATLRESTAFGTGGPGTATTRMGCHLPYSDGVVYWDYENTSAGRLTASGLTFGNDLWVFTAGQARGMEIWQNGYLRASKTTAEVRTTSANDFYINQGNGLVIGSSGDLAQCWLFRMYNRQLSPSCIAQTFRDPWGLYRGVDYGAVNVVGGGGGNRRRRLLIGA